MDSCYQKAYRELFLATADTIDVLNQILDTMPLSATLQIRLRSELIRLQSAQQKAEEWILADSEE
ncbi:MAG: hypothetical protein Q4D37_08655 [Oscillospiraceae bacterium]|nr:hypothetical protein [Oscillospiraceae bacterium]